MNLKSRSRILCCILTFVLCFACIPFNAISAAVTLTNNITGTEDGYDYELWKDSGTTSMVLTGGGTFSCSWSNINNALFRKGKKFNSTQTYKEIGNISVEYACDYNPDGNSYLCVYGWTKSPLVEYYIVESWGTWRPPGATAKGQVTIDGGTYDIYETTRVNQPSIEGDTTFQQYWSVRTTKRTSGTISVSEHFKAWESFGMPMGKMYEAALTVEGYQSSGTANVTKNNIIIGGDIPDPTDPPKTVEPDENGYYFHSTYESGTDGWETRGASKISSSGTAACVGSKSLFVSGRTDSWNGTGRTLDTAAFVPGSAYSFSAMVMQNSGSSQELNMTLQYDDASGETQYAQVATVTAKNGEWAKLENTSYTIPSGASNLLLYIETPENLIDFYVDEAIGAVKGTKNPASGSSTTIYPIGDVNHSGTVDATDLIDLSGYLLNDGTKIYADTSDINGDKVVDCFDLCLLRKLLTEATDDLEPGQWRNTADISWIDTSKPMVALSFDDGPVGTASTATSTRIQDALADNGAHATFFYWGNRITSSNQSEISRAKQLGFEVANHTYTHPYLTNLTANEINDEITKTSDILSGLTGGQTNFLIRPPYLSVNATVKENCGAPLITCGVDVQDWNNATAQQIINTITSGMSNGTLDNKIVLMHETYTTTAEAIEYLAPYMKSQGWQIVTVSELFKANGKDMYSGEVYTAAS